MNEESAKKLLDETFGKEFNTEGFSKFIKELFNNFCINPRNLTQYIRKEYWDYIESYQSLGSYKDTSNESIDLLIVKLKRTSSRDRARTMQRNFIANHLTGYNEHDAALVAFYGENPQDWRFSFVKMDYHLTKDDDGKVKTITELTPAKRYSFLVGVNEPNHTCKKQFLKLVMREDSNPSIEEIENAFSIDNVTKEFFEKYRELYWSLKESLDKIIEKDKYIKKHFEDKNILTVDFSKKLMGQIVFIYFLQKKGWLGVGKDAEGRFKEWGTGPKNFLQKLFEQAIKEKKNFFNTYLEILFYDALSTEREDDYYPHWDCKIPFLNGGLFEPINEYNWRETNILIDNSIFEQILKTFNQYNFTVKEDEPLEKEVAVDPEILGKVFENLLEVKDRKSKGAFYTPREIVHYICQQSLINYLETNSNVLKEDIEKFIQFGDMALSLMMREQEQIKKYGKSDVGKKKYNLPEAIKRNYQEFDKLLKNIKIVDPAVGSGAFLVGMMNEIVKARRVLTEFYGAGEKERRTNYALKRETIENSLYGVDIDSSAVDITMLRFWLSLIVDEEDIKQIKPLPNLDYKIICGNSLLEEFEGVKLFDEELLGSDYNIASLQLNIIKEERDKLFKEKDEIGLEKYEIGLSSYNNERIDEIDAQLKNLEKRKKELENNPKEESYQYKLGEEIKIKKSQTKLKELKSIQKIYFNEQNRNKKKQYAEDINRIEWELIEETLKEQGNEEAMEKLQQYKKHKSKPFFLWKLYFSDVFRRENPGFDVVVGNPPYVRQESITGQKPIYERLYHEVYTGTADLSIYFVKRSIDLARYRGCHSFIITNKWLRAKYGENLRNYLAENITIANMVDFNGVKVFAGATVDALVYVFKKTKPFNNKLRYCSYKEKSLGNIDEYVKNNGFDIEQEALKRGWNFYQNDVLEIKKKIEEVGIPLKNWDVKIYYGIKTGFNEAFIIDTETKEKLCKEDPKSAEILKPILRGRDIYRYGYKWAGLWIIIVKYGFHTEIEKNYSAILSHLIKYKDSLQNRGQCKYSRGGKNNVGQHHWLELDNNPKDNYLNEFEKEKIVWQEIVREPSFAYDNKNIYCEATSFLMTGKGLKYLIAILNSKPATFFFKQFYAGGGLGESGYRYKKAFLERLPIPKISESDQKPFIHLCNYMLFLNETEELRNSEKEMIDFFDRQIIDSLVYEIYFAGELKTNLVELVSPYLTNISVLSSDSEKLNTIKKVYNNLIQDEGILNLIKEIRGHKWVKIIEKS